MKVDGEKLQAEIASRQMTILDFAKKACVPTSTVYRALNGKRSSTRTAGRFAKALGISPAELSQSSTAQMKEVI